MFTKKCPAVTFLTTFQIHQPTGPDDQTSFKMSFEVSPTCHNNLWFFSKLISGGLLQLRTWSCSINLINYSLTYWLLIIKSCLSHQDMQKANKQRKSKSHAETQNAVFYNVGSSCVLVCARTCVFLPYLWLSLSLSVIIIKVNCAPCAKWKIQYFHLWMCVSLLCLPLQLHSIITTLSQHIARTMDHFSQESQTLKFPYIHVRTSTSNISYQHNISGKKN